ncbi:uncharacterized protein LAESUDRAFT_507205 [Laetiporus sulphureus 93-53]|uniref:Uncharacterized protein n=1 Tax=Laetiporus sulphureus 93-53 TaxID=1314785 RepID=A0A165FW22_9APHY|nr:uncharacterized protein LAESUDRAFT_507205 [Laetiporus sulphureus 93-53]KZT09484.1 hypothetical protein LAESUDRAFT_507205 [Laetiporus sulphureus 93-53]
MIPNAQKIPHPQVARHILYQVTLRERMTESRSLAPTGDRRLALQTVRMKSSWWIRTTGQNAGRGGCKKIVVCRRQRRPPPKAELEHERTSNFRLVGFSQISANKDAERRSRCKERPMAHARRDCSMLNIDGCHACHIASVTLATRSMEYSIYIRSFTLFSLLQLPD